MHTDRKAPLRSVRTVRIVSLSNHTDREAVFSDRISLSNRTDSEAVFSDRISLSILDMTGLLDKPSS